MTQIDSIDFANGRIHLHADTVANGVDPILVYQEYCALVQSTAAYQVYNELIRGEGNEAKGGGTFTPQRADLASGKRLVPNDTSHVLTVLNEIVCKADSVSFASCFDRSGLSSGVEVDIQQGYKDVEIREVSTGDGLNAANQAKLDAINTATAKLTFDGDNHVASNVQKINDAEILGDGSTTDKLRTVNT